MCRWETEGTKFGCGHYCITKKVHLHDCQSPLCRYSSQHPQSHTTCPHCREGACAQFYGPDIRETVTATTPEYCSTCHYWYEGEGAKRK